MDRILGRVTVAGVVVLIGAFAVEAASIWYEPLDGWVVPVFISGVVVAVGAHLVRIAFKRGIKNR